MNNFSERPAICLQPDRDISALKGKCAQLYPIEAAEPKATVWLGDGSSLLLDRSILASSPALFLCVCCLVRCGKTSVRARSTPYAVILSQVGLHQWGRRGRLPCQRLLIHEARRRSIG